MLSSGARYGSLGFIALPNVFLFQLLLPVISPIADLMFVWSLVSIWMNASVQSANERFAHARQDLEQVLWLLRGLPHRRLGSPRSSPS